MCIRYSGPLRFLSILISLSLLLCFATKIQAGSASAVANFTAAVRGGTCEVALDKTTIQFGTVSSSGIIAAGTDGVSPQNLTLSFSNCAGWGLTPKIQVAGTTITSGISLFRNNSAAIGYSQGYGVRLVEAGQTTVINDQDKLTVGNATDFLTVLDQSSVTFEASLSCGSCTAGPGLHGGNLNATITFQFLYE